MTSRVLNILIRKIKLPPVGYWTHNTNPTYKNPATLPIQPKRHLLNRRFMNWALDHFRFNRAWLYKGLKVWDWHDWQISWVGKVAGISKVGWCCEFKSHWRQFILKLFETLDDTFVQKCQICVENEKPEWGLDGGARPVAFVMHGHSSFPVSQSCITPLCYQFKYHYFRLS